MNWKAKIIIAIGLGMSFYGCRPDDDLSSIPTLESRDFSVSRTVDQEADFGLWTLGFTDGDGDFGIRENTIDTTANNFIGTAYQIKNGVESILPNELSYKIPAIPEVNTSRGVRGKVEISIQLNLFVGRGYDTMRIEGYLLDRAQNQSNTVSSPLIVLN